MTTWLVTRHKGAEEWASLVGVCPDAGCVVASLEPKRVEAGDLIVGTLPINIAAEIVAKGARYLHLSLNLPPEARGQELSPGDMRKYGARLEEYEIRKTTDYQGATAPEGQTERPVVMICIASEQTLPNLLPLFKWKSDGKPVAALHVVCSDSKKIEQAVRNIQNVISRLNVEASIHVGMPEGPLIDIQDFASHTLKKIRDQHPNGHFVLNATGGTKTMAIAMLHALGPNGDAIYCDTDRERIEFIQPARQAAIPLPVSGLTVDLILMAHGLEASKTQSMTLGWLEKARQRESCTAYLRKLAAAGESEHFFAALQSILYIALPDNKKPFKAKVAQHEIKGKVPKNFKHLCAKLEHAGLICISDEGYEFPDADAARYLKSDWLEEMLALAVDLICQRRNIGGQQWRSGMCVVARGATSDKALNEIDMALAYRNRLLVIECKSGAGASKDDQNITNKLETVGGYIGGRLADKWLLCSRVIYGQATLRERCNTLKIQLLEHDSLKPGVLEQRLETWLGFPPVLSETQTATAVTPAHQT